jgi:Tfp pilus assembly protein PilV
MAKLINKQVPASTLLEVLIAMVIIMTVFTVALKVFNNVLSSSVSLKKIRVHNQLNLLKEEARQYGFRDETLEVDSILYTYQVNQIEVANLSQLEIKATEHGKLLGSIKFLIKQTGNHED